MDGAREKIAARESVETRKHEVRRETDVESDEHA
jgi:hypothetical protein